MVEGVLTLVTIERGQLDRQCSEMVTADGGKARSLYFVKKTMRDSNVSTSLKTPVSVRL